METMPYLGSTSEFFRVAPGIILKSPMKVWEGNPNRKPLDEENEQAIVIEQQMLEQLGSHRRIIPFPRVYGIRLREATHGSLQAYIDSNNATLSIAQRWNLCEQVAEAIIHAHSKGVLHSDLRPENFLVHEIIEQFANIWLCDFGGSTCAHLNLDGGHLPDIPFSDPRVEWKSTPTTDIFSLGSIFYTILTGYWPFMNGTPQWSSMQDKLAYQDQVEILFREGKFPVVSHLSGGDVINGCWHYRYHTAEEVLQAFQSRRKEMVAESM